MQLDSVWAARARFLCRARYSCVIVVGETFHHADLQNSFFWSSINQQCNPGHRSISNFNFFFGRFVTNPTAQYQHDQLNDLVEIHPMYCPMLQRALCS
jgi:hypothetical protein